MTTAIEAVLAKHGWVNTEGTGEWTRTAMSTAVFTGIPEPVEFPVVMPYIEQRQIEPVEAPRSLAQPAEQE